MRRLLAIAFICLAATPALALNRVKLSNGNTIEGRVVSQNIQYLVLETQKGQVSIPVADIVKIEKIEPKKTVPAPGATGTATSPADPDAKPVEERFGELTELEGKRLLRLLGSRDLHERARGSNEVLAGWPATAVVLEKALTGKVEAARVTVVHLLDEPRLGDTSDLLRKAVNSPSERVRLIAARKIRSNKLEQFEAELMARVMLNDPSWAVRLEALRGLEEIGTMRCAKTVFYSLRVSKKPRWRKKCLRVLRKVTLCDHGENVRAWGKAIDWRLRTGGGRQPTPKADSTTTASAEEQPTSGPKPKSAPSSRAIVLPAK